MEAKELINLEDRFACHRQSPIRHQVLSMDFDPRLNQFHLGPRQVSSQYLAILDGDSRCMLGIFGMNMRATVLLVVIVVHQNEYTVEHGYGRHEQPLLACAQQQLGSARSSGDTTAFLSTP